MTFHFLLNVHKVLEITFFCKNEAKPKQTKQQKLKGFSEIKDQRQIFEVGVFTREH